MVYNLLFILLLSLFLLYLRPLIEDGRVYKAVPPLYGIKLGKDKYQYFTEAKMDKLRNAGYDKPFTSLEDGIADYVKNYLVQDKTF